MNPEQTTSSNQTNPPELSPSSQIQASSPLIIPNHNPSLKILLVTMVIFFLLVIIGSVFYIIPPKNNSSINNPLPLAPQSSSSPSKSSALDSIDSIKLSDNNPPLSKLDFPTEPTEYPSSWPRELTYSDSFTLYEATSGAIIEKSNYIWSSKLRSQTTLDETAENLTKHFEDLEWQVKEVNIEPKGILLFIERDNKQSTGQIILSSDPSEQTIKILSTIRL